MSHSHALPEDWNGPRPGSAQPEGVEHIGEILPHVLGRLSLPRPQPAPDEPNRRDASRPEPCPAPGVVA